MKVNEVAFDRRNRRIQEGCACSVGELLTTAMAAVRAAAADSAFIHPVEVALSRARLIHKRFARAKRVLSIRSVPRQKKCRDLLIGGEILENAISQIADTCMGFRSKPEDNDVIRMNRISFRGIEYAYRYQAVVG